MKHLFIVNPIAGGGKTISEHVDHINEYMESICADYEIYTTVCPMDAAEKVKREAQLGAELRVYACGGDGTLNECAHGAAGFKNVALTHFPCGTGNDFIRMFGDEAPRFSDLAELVNGEVMPFDIVDCNGRKCLNICSVGLDARIASDVHKYSKLPVVGGACGYVVSTAVNAFKGINRRFRIKAEGFNLDAPIALMCACNGRYYGGGFNPTRKAMPNDGKLEVLIANKVNIFQVASLIGKYAKGEYEQMPELITYLQVKKIEASADEKFAINIDGEILYSNDVIMKIIPEGINFIVPKNLAFFSDCKKPVRA